MSAKLVDIGRINLADVPAMLRRMAEQIENGEMGEPRTVVVVVDDGCKTIVSSCGPASDYHYTMATLAIAQIQMVR